MKMIQKKGTMCGHTLRFNILIKTVFMILYALVYTVVTMMMMITWTYDDTMMIFFQQHIVLLFIFIY